MGQISEQNQPVYSNVQLAKSKTAATCPVESEQPDEPLVMAATESRALVAGGIGCICVIWNGIVLVAGVAMLKQPNIGSFIFISIFGLVGLGLLAGAIYTTLQVFNPKPILVCSQRNIYPGSEFELSWMFKGNTSKVEKLRILVEGIEEVKYRQGTSTRTEKATFFQKTVVETTDSETIRQGFEMISIPDDTMHSFKAPNNSFIWQVRVEGSIKNWPDIQDRFEFILLTPQVATAT